MINTDDLDLRNMDCMKLMAEFEDNHFDLAITSPPYNMNLRVNSRGDGYCSRQVVKELSTKYENFSDNLPMDEYADFLVESVSELLRVSRMVFFNIQMVTGNKPAIFKMMGHFADQIKEVIIWDKGSGQPAIGAGVMNSSYEYIIVFGGNPIARAFADPCFPRGTLDNIWRIGRSSSADSSHRASFPLQLVETILRNFSSEGCKVVDPFLGTGTTAIACHYAKCHLTASELDKDYYDAAIERIERETAQTELF